MRRAVLLATLVLGVVGLSSCVSIGGGGQAVETARPAPANALACALETSVSLGYQPTSGGVADGFITLMRHRNEPAGRILVNLGLIVSTLGLVQLEWKDWDVLRLVGAGSSLNVVAWSTDDDGDQGGMTEEGGAAVQTVLDRCAPGP